MSIKKNTALLLGSLPVISAFAAENAAKPNILFIVTDQQSFNTINALRDAYSYHNTYSTTPNLDKLVQNGISFTNTYCANPVSVPSRFAMFTGLYGGKYNIRDNKIDGAVQSTVLAALNTYAMGNVFKAGGYQTVYAGKVHLPFATVNGGMFGAPVNYGFTSYISDDDRAPMATTVTDYIKTRTSTTPLLLVASFINPHDICLESSTNLSSTLTVDPKKPEIAETVSLARQAADKLTMEQFPALPQNQTKTAGFPSTFTPNVFDNFPNDYWRRYRYIYSWLVNLVDQHVGEVLTALENSPLKNNTIVVFTSDHGEMQGAHTATVKNLPFEECQRVPFIIMGPGIVQNQRDNSLLCNGTDILPTICELAGINKPAGLTGVSVASRAKGTGSVTQRQYLYSEGDGFSTVVENPAYKYTQFHITGNPEMLIDLTSDAGELTSVATKNATYTAKTTQLRNVLTSAMANGGILSAVNKPVVKPLLVTVNQAHTEIAVGGLNIDSTLEIYDITGRKVFTKKADSNRENISVSNLNAGVFIVKSESQSQKIIL